MSSSSFGIRGRTRPRASSCEEEDKAARRPRRARQALWMLIALLLCFAFWQFSSAALIHAKAIVAQRLIASAWAQARGGGPARRPWPWADMRPIARMRLPARQLDLYVFDNASPRALAFGPAHVSGTAAPGAWGNSVIVAHRDTHFAFLRNLEIDEEIAIETATGALARYRVREVAIVDKTDTRVLDSADSAQLTLITCYPFDAVQPGSRQRYVVIAERVA